MTNLLKFRIVRVDMNGFNGRENHPQPEDVGAIVTAVALDLTFADERGRFCPATYRGRVIADALPLLNGEQGDDSAHELIAMWTCATVDGRLLDLLDFEIEPAEARARAAQDAADGLRACTGAVQVTVTDGDVVAVSPRVDDAGDL